MAQDVAGTLACNTGPNGNDAGNFCSNQGVDAGYIVAVNIEHALGANGGSNAASVKLRDVAEPLTRSEHKGHTLVLDAFAFANRTRDGVKLPEIMPGGVAPALMTADAINVCIPIQEVGERTGPSSTGDVRAGIGLAKNGDPMFTLQAGAQHGVLAYGIAVDAVDQGDARATTADGITELDAVPTLQGQGCGAVSSAMCVRRITPRECERLQGFPDDYTAIVFRGKPAADGPRYKALGNSMAVPVMRWIGARIQRFDVEALPAIPPAAPSIFDLL